VSTHTCPAPGCAREVSDELLACREHWYALPKPLRDALWRAYNDHGRGSPAHTAAVDACLRAFEQLGRGSSPAAPSALSLREQVAALAPADLVRLAYHVPPDIEVSLPPAFLLAGTYAAMWDAWRAVQAGGRGECRTGTGWRVEAFERREGGTTMRLEVYFLPTGGS
jgi:hypothetical protein